jgi:hypothetical protein
MNDLPSNGAYYDSGIQMALKSPSKNGHYYYAGVDSAIPEQLPKVSWEHYSRKIEPAFVN